jgi:hypothetical protein
MQKIQNWPTWQKLLLGCALCFGIAYGIALVIQFVIKITG